MATSSEQIESSGLSEAEATQRLQQHGDNELPFTKSRSILATAWSVVREPMFLLLLACGTTFFLGLVLYVPFLRDLFHFSALHPADLLLCLAAGSASILWFEGLKLFKQKWRA